MTIRKTLIAFAALATLFMPNVAIADDHNGKDKCNVPAAQQDDDCKEKRKGGFQTRFF